MDAAVSVVQSVARTAHGRVPFDALNAANVWETGHLPLSLPMVPCYEAIDTVGARYVAQRTRGIVVASVVRNWGYC